VNWKRLLSVLSLGLALLISACSSSASPAVSTPVEPPEEGATTALPPTVAAEPTSTEPGPVVVTETPADPTCEVDPPRPTPNPTDEMLFSVDPEEDWTKGPADAAITIVEYGDFQCPYCAQAAANLEDLLEAYPEDVRLVYRHFPLASIHDKAILAAQAAEAAGRQEAFWDMHDLLYARQGEWSGLSPEEFQDWVIDRADELALDPVQYQADLTSEEIVSQAEAAWTDGQNIGLPGTPYLKINQVYEAQADPRLLETFVEMIKLEDQQFSECPPLTVDEEGEYQATLITEKGEIVIDLYPGEAPLAVNSFLFLAEEGWFEGITFHRVLEGFVAQTGDPTGTGFGGPGYKFGLETSADLTFDRKGLVALANSGPDTNGSQFFITLAPAPNLNGQYTIFGEVVDGMDVVNSLTLRDPQTGQDLPAGDLLLDVKISRK